MALPSYPQHDYDQGRELLRQLGSFWSNVFQDADKLQAHLRSSGHVQGQIYLNYIETVACLSRLTVPVFHRENWRLLTITKSAAFSISTVFKPDDLVFGPQEGNVEARPEGSVATYGAPETRWTMLPMPDDLVQANFTLQNLVLYPSKVWVNGVDYHLDSDRHAFAFKDNLFDDPLVPSRDILDANGHVVDQEIAFWVYNGDYDLNYIYTHFGYVLGLKLDTSEGYKQILNAVWDMYVSGFSPNNLTMFLAAMSGAPTVIGPKETVELIRQEEDCKLIITDSQVYKIPFAAEATVEVGDEIVAGQSICDAVSVADLAGYDPNYSMLPAISLSTPLMSGRYFGEISFKNHDVTIEYSGLDDNGKAIVRFETGGFPADIETFWELVQSRGVTAGKTLADLLDTRTNKVGEPTALNMPPFINPLKFILDNLLRNNMFVIKVRSSSFDENAPGLSFFRLLRNVVPPHTTFVVFIELVPPTDVIDLSATGDEDDAGAEEEVGKFKGASAESDDAYELADAAPGEASYEDAHVSARLVSTTCQ